MGSLLLSLLLVGAGWWVLRPAPPEKGSGGWLLRICWAPAIGAGVLSLAFFLSVYLGFGGRLAVLIIALVLLAVLRWGVSRQGAESMALEDSPVREDSRLMDRALLILLLAGLVLLLWGFSTWSLHRPHGTTDAVHIWNARALLLIRGDVGRLPEIFAEQKFGQPDYPLFLPALVAAGERCFSVDMLAFHRAQGLFFAVALIGAVYAFAKVRGGRYPALLAALIVLSSPGLHRWSFAQVADVPLALLVTLAFMGVIGPMGRSPLPPFAVGFVAGLLPWTKNEGGPLLLALLAGLALRAVRRREPSGMTLMLAGALPGLLATVLFKLTWSPASQVGRFFGLGWAERMMDLDRWRLILSSTIRWLFSLDGLRVWGLTWILVAVLLGVVLSSQESRSRLCQVGEGAAVAFLVLGAIAYALAFATTVLPLDWHLRALRRIPIHLLPAIALTLLEALRRSRSEASEPPQSA